MNECDVYEFSLGIEDSSEGFANGCQILINGIRCKTFYVAKIGDTNGIYTRITYSKKFT